MAVGASPDAFLILGHGTENIVNFESRPKLPAGYTLVTIAECGIYSTSNEVCPIVEAFTSEKNRDIFMNPKIHKAEIEGFMKGKSIHIYRPGSSYPSLSLQMFLDWPTDKFTNISKSGVYKFPINSEDVQIGNGSTFCEKLFKKIKPYTPYARELPDDYNATIQFKNSLIPTADEVSKLVTASKISGVVKKQLIMPLEAIFDKCGPGVYYYVICRSPKSIMSPEELINGDLLSLNTVTKLQPYKIKNWTSKINEIIPILESNKHKSPKWALETLNSTIDKYKELLKVPHIRRMSILQQEGMGRKTRKQIFKKHKRRTQKK